MSTSLTWQQLPAWLLEPVLDKHLSLVEAAELWDHCLTQTEEFKAVPKHLHPATMRLHLLDCEISQTLH